MGTAEEEGFIDISFALHCAVYALLQGRVVVYIGQTKMPLTRLYSHANARGRMEPWRPGYTKRKVGFKFDGIWLMPCLLHDLDELEAKMIRKYNPKHNTQGRLPNAPLDISALLKSVAIAGPSVEAPIRRRV
jgi:hypothetical protein